MAGDGLADLVIQRIIEFILSLPTIPLWMGLAAALPGSWPVQRVYLAITIIISLLGWTELARVVRGRFLTLREEDFITAAELAGCSRMRIIFRHMVPSFLSHIIAATTLAIPAMIISETSLSFLGLGGPRQAQIRYTAPLGGGASFAIGLKPGTDAYDYLTRWLAEKPELHWQSLWADYVKAFWNIANWQDVAARFERARSQTQGLV